jgi:3-hydroxymyristoyl/3-hydroxydecanoyl-(acyl carrier protein) dehydratase
MMAQAGGVLAGISHGFSKEVILGKVEKAEFLREVVPPRSIEITASLVAEDDQSAWAEMKLRDESGEAASSKIMFVFLNSFKTTGDEKNIVFNEIFLKNFHLKEYRQERAFVSA